MEDLQIQSIEKVITSIRRGNIIQEKNINELVNNLLENFTGKQKAIEIRVDYISLIMGAYQTEIKTHIRIQYLDILTSNNFDGRQARYHQKLWIKNVFINFNHNIESNPIWFEQIKFMLESQYQRKQIYLSKLVAQQVNKQMRTIKPSLRFQLLNLIFNNDTLANWSIKIIMKHYEYLDTNLKRKIRSNDFRKKYGGINYFTLFIKTKMIEE